MEPLSVAASIIGILATSAKIVTVVTDLVRREKDTPQSLHRVLTEVSELNTCLAQLAPFIQGAKSTDRGRKDTISLEQVVVINTSLVLNMSELDKTLDSYNLGDKISKFNRMRWMMDETKILEILNSVRASKASLNLILTLFTCTALEDAQASITRLNTSVERILENSIDVSQRLARMEHPFAASTFQGKSHDNASTIPPKAHNDTSTYEHLEQIAQDPSRQVVYDARSLREAGGTSNINAGEGRDNVGLRQRSQGLFPQFDKDLELELHTSWVYSRSTDRHSISSLPSKINSTTGMSLLSAVSLAQVSSISVFELPICYHEIWNPQYYNDQFLVGKVILVGPDLSGKTTLSKQMQIVYADGFPLKEKREYRIVILDNLLVAFNMAIEEMKKRCFEYERTASIAHAHALQKIKGFEFDDSIPRHFIVVMKELFADKGFQRVVGCGNQYGLYENFQYCMDNIDRLASTANVLSDQDVLRSRVRTTGMMNTVFGLPSLKLSVFDCGGRSKRREWVHYFDDVQCIIFVAALSGYDETLFEDRTGNQMEEALRLFELMISLTWSKGSSIVLLLTKLDLFEKKLPHSPVRNYIPEYAGSDVDSEGAKEFFIRTFLSLNHEESRSIHVRCVSATNTDHVREELRKIESLVSGKLPQVPEP